MKYSTLILAAGLVFSGSVSAQDLEQVAAKAPASVKAEATTASFVKMKANAAIAPAKGGVLAPSKTVRFGMSRAASAEAFYTQPEGVFSYGLSDGLSGMSRGTEYRFGGSFCDYVFTNKSENATSYEWTYEDVETGDALTSKSVDLSVNLPLNVAINSPVLKANGEGGSSTYKLPNDTANVIYMGTATTQILFMGMDEPMTLGISTYGANWNKGAEWTMGDLFMSPLTGRANEMWKGSLGADSIRMTGFINIFDKPLQPYFITKMWGWFNVKSTKPVSLLCSIYKAEYDENGFPVKGEMYAEGEAVVPAQPNGGSVVPTFPLYILNEDGDQVEGAVVVNEEIIVEVTGFDGADGLEEIAPIWGTGNLAYRYEPEGPIEPTVKNHAFFEIDAMANDGQTVSVICPQPAFYGAGVENTFLQTSDLAFMTDAVFPFCSIDKNIVNIPVSGGSDELAVDCYWIIRADGTGACALAAADEDADTDWINVEIVEEDGMQYLTFSADACTDPNGRKARLVLYGIAMNPVYFWVNQGADVAIEGVEADKEVKTVEYFDVMGRKLNAQPENGMFIRKAVMTDGSVKTDKVAK